MFGQFLVWLKNLPDILVAIVGGVVGAVATYWLTVRQSRIDERDTAFVALSAELLHNLSVGVHVLEKNIPLLDRDKSDWWELASFSVTSWQSVVNSGALSRLPAPVVGPLAGAYAEIEITNYSALRLQIGDLTTTKAKRYTLRVFEAAEAACTALVQLKSESKDKRRVEGASQSQDQSVQWQDRLRTWKPVIEAAATRLVMGNVCSDAERSSSVEPKPVNGGGA